MESMQLYMGLVVDEKLVAEGWARSGVTVGRGGESTLRVERDDYPESVEIVREVDGAQYLVLSAVERAQVLVDGEVLSVDGLRALESVRDGELLRLSAASRGRLWVSGVKVLFRFLDPRMGPPWP